jgi:superfamily II RNA helicase
MTGLDCVIFDECHYINDRDRGAVWEETMMLLPPSVQMIMLSATLDRPDKFADWLGDLKKVPCALIQTTYRVVPLIHNVLEAGTYKRIPIMESKNEVFAAEKYKSWIRDRKKLAYDHDKFKEKVADLKAQGVEGGVEGKVVINSFVHLLNGAIEVLLRDDMMPALAFVFSRKDCERYAGLIKGSLFQDDMDAGYHAHRVFDFHLRHHKEALEKLPVYHKLRDLVGRGIGFHHSGLLPVLKEVLEILFSRGFLKLMFATETFAVGLNMPTRTVLFMGLRKYADDCDGLRLLRNDEYTQMAGRAGRRGKDTIGYVIYLPDREPVDVFDIRGVLKGGLPALQSAMTFDYEFILKAYALGWEAIMEKSYWFKQYNERVEEIRRAVEEARGAAAAAKPDEAYLSELEKKGVWVEELKTAINAAKKDVQRKIENWKNTHIGPRWAAAEKSYEEYKKLADKYRGLADELSRYESYKIPIMQKIEFLENMGYIADGKLTALGLAATECNESHALIMPKIIYSGMMDGLSTIEIIRICALFVEGSGDCLTALPTEVEAIVDTLKNGEIRKSVDYWKLDGSMTDIIGEWAAADADANISALCETYEIFEGNFVRAILKVANILEEVGAVASLAGNIGILEKIEGARNLLVRGVVVPDSLYIGL